MQLISAWKNSIQALNRENIKQLFQNIVTALPQIYKNWFLYGLPLIGLLALTSFIHVKFGLLPAEKTLMIILPLISSLMVAAMTITLCAIVRDAVYNREFRFASYKKHLIIGTILLAVPFFWAWQYSSPISIIEGDIKRRDLLEKKMAESIAAGKKPKNPALYDKINKILEEKPNILLYFLLALGISCLGMIIFMQLGTYPLFFFFDTTGSFSDAFKSVGKALCFIFFNLPFIAITYGATFGSIRLFMKALFFFTGLNATFDHSTYANTLWFIGEPIFLMPVFITLASAIYKNYKDRTI